MKRPPSVPGDVLWLIAVVSLVLPWLAAGLALWGVYLLRAGDVAGWWLVGGGAVLAVLDVVTDLWLAHPSVSASEQPDLNRRGAQYLGRIVALEQAIEGGRGKVRLGDTLWTVAGPDLPQGARVRITGSNGTVLEVEAA